MLRSCPVQPLSLPENALARRDSGSASKPVSTTVSFVPSIIVLEREDHERRRLAGRVERRIARARMPAKGEVVLRLDVLDPGFHHDVVVAANRDAPAGLLAGLEWLLEIDAEPLIELPNIGERAPDARAGSLEDDLLLDTVGGRRGHT